MNPSLASLTDFGGDSGDVTIVNGGGGNFIDTNVGAVTIGGSGGAAGNGGSGSFAASGGAFLGNSVPADSDGNAGT